MVILICILIALFLLESCLLEFEQFGWATTVMIVTVIGSMMLGEIVAGFRIIEFAKTYYQQAVLYSLLYFVSGVVWSFGKWFFYLMRIRDEIKEGKHEINKYNERFMFLLNGKKAPEASKHKSKIVAWICYWPFSFVGTILNDPLRRFVNFIYNRLGSTYQKMSDYIFRE